MFALKTYFHEKQELINTALTEYLKDTSKNSKIIHAIRYSLEAGGKRLRPILCLAATEAVGGKAKDVLETACALEMIHTYSLIHDDLPAIDNDDLRRGKHSCHIAFDEATAILTGDALLTMAFQLLSSNKDKNAVSEKLKVIHSIAEAAGYQGMIEGQMRDIYSEGKNLSIEKLKEIHYLKTGALIEASVYVGAVLGNGEQKQIEDLKTFARNIGLAFQVADDMLNVNGDPEIMGKAVGTDKIMNKITFPSLMGIEKSRKFAANLIRNALHALENFDNKTDPLRAIANYIIERTA